LEGEEGGSRLISDLKNSGFPHTGKVYRSYDKNGGDVDTLVSKWGRRNLNREIVKEGQRRGIQKGQVLEVLHLSPPQGDNWG